MPTAALSGARPPRRDPFASPTVTADWLAGHLGQVVVADVRWSLTGGPKWREYAGGHIPGAVFVDLDEDLSGPPSPLQGRHPLPEPQRFAERLEALGIGEDTPVVAYDDAGGSIAARLWWLLRALGSPVAVLDGGLAAWTGRLSAAAPIIRAARRSVRPWPAERFVDTECIGQSGALLIDARAPSRYAEGDRTVDPRPGHIPGAVNAPWGDNLDHRTGLFLPRVELRRRFAALGAEGSGRVISYCGSGVTACHDLLALELAGVHHTALYPGSWSAWASDPDRPAEVGPGPAGSV